MIYLIFVAARMDDMIFHIPHASTMIPAPLRDQFVLDDVALTEELRVMTDWYTDDLFHGCAANGDAFVMSPVSRLVVDVERFVDEADEPMSRVGMGAVYDKTSDGRVLRRSISSEERSALIEQYYRPHHEKLERAVRTEIERFGQSIIIDCHSFPETPLSYERDQTPKRPDICIGTDAFHTPMAWSDMLIHEFSRQKFTTALNRPFSGAMVPERYFRLNANVQSIMIELKRSLYMNEQTGEKKACFADLQETLREILSTLRGSPPRHRKPVKKLRSWA